MRIIASLTLSLMKIGFLLFILFNSLHAASESACSPISEVAASLSESQLLVAKSEWRRAIDQDDAKDIKRLLPLVDVKITNGKGKTALMAAVKIGDHCLVQELLQRGLSMTDKGYTGGTALMYAVLGNQLAMIEKVLSYDPDLDAQSTNGWTAVMIAAAKGFDASIRVLHEAGADIDLADVYEWTPLMRALDNRHSAVVDFLLSLPDIDLDKVNEGGSSVLHIAAQVGDLQAVRHLLQLGVDRSLKDKSGYLAVDVAVLNGHAQIAELIEAVAK